MNERITIKVDLTKLDKSRITERTYTNKEGQEITVKEYSMDVVGLKPENHKEIASGNGWKIVKKYFVANTSTKEERQNKVNTAIIGEGTVIENTTAPEYPAGPDGMPDF